MSKKTSEDRALLDSKGYPSSLDPHKFYEYSIDSRIRNSEGIELFLWKLMPQSVMKSFAIAIDPFSGLKQSSTRITPATRKRKRRRVSVLDNQRKIMRRSVTISEYSIPNWNNIPGIFSPYTVQGSPVIQNGTDSLGEQNMTIPEEMSDTTRRTRILGSELGECESFTYSIYSPPRSLSREDVSNIRLGKNPIYIGGDSINNTSIVYRRIVTPSAARILSTSLSLMKTRQHNQAVKLLQDNALLMFNRATPDSRQYSLFRNLVELKDLPRSIFSLREALLNLHKLVQGIPDQSLRRLILDVKDFSGKHVPSEYLSYQFGWRQLYGDVMDFVHLPEKLTKRFNYLNRQLAKNRVLRSRRKLSFPNLTAPVSFEYANTDIDVSPRVTSSYEEDAELSLVMGYGIEFPDLLAPVASASNVARLTGLYPTPLDLYNLIPWTWLVDWFTGLDNYVEAIQRIGSDRKLVDYCLLSVEINGKLTSSYHSQTKSTYKTDYRPYGGSKVVTYSETLNGQNHDSVAEFKTVKRVDLAGTQYGIESTAEPDKLSSYRRSILSALLLQSLEYSRKK